MASIRGSNWVTSLRLPPVRITASGVPWPSVIRWCFDPDRARSTGLGPVWSPFCGPHVAGIDDGPRPVETGRRVQLGQQHFVQALPDAGLVPVAQLPPARHARPEAQLLQQDLPLNAGVEHEEDAAQHLPVGQRLPARVPEPTLLARQERLDPLPRVIRHDPRRSTHASPTPSS